MRTSALAALLALGAPLWAQYTPYVTDTLIYQGYPGPIDSNKWAQSSGYAATSPYGLIADWGTMLTPVYTPGGGWADYEIRASLSTSYYATLFARVSGDLSSYYALVMSYTLSNSTHYVWTFYRVASGTWTAISSAPFVYHPGVQVRLVAR